MRQKQSSPVAADLDAGRIDMLRGQAKSRKRREHPSTSTPEDRTDSLAHATGALLRFNRIGRGGVLQGERPGTIIRQLRLRILGVAVAGGVKKDFDRPAVFRDEGIARGRDRRLIYIAGSRPFGGGSGPTRSTVTLMSRTGLIGRSSRAGSHSS